MNPSFPSVFGKYILLKPLAHGGMGRLFLAFAGEMGGFEKLCVIKRVRATGQNQSLVRRFQDESKVVVKLSHGNLVQVFDVGAVGDEVYLAMEHVEGRDLRDVMVRCDETRTPVPVEVALYITMQVLRGLHYTHNYGNLKLVHRDICPSNVLVSFFGEVKITDFGLAQSVLKQEMTAPGKVYGRFSYLAPEQARREEADLRTDLYATGIILWELLVGQPMRPGAQDDPSTTLSVIRSGKVVPPSSRSSRVPSELDAVVARALQARREDRYSTSDQMRGELARVLARRNPAFDAGGVASFMRRLYGDQIDAARREREALLAQDFSRLRRPSAPMPLSGSPPGEPEDLSGQVVDGRYKVMRLLGEGGMGAVYEAEHMEIGRHMAIKIMHAAYSSHPETMARFRQEARSATQIGHPNIVEVTDSGTTADGRLFFVMELLSGEDLAQVMTETRIVPARRALRITLQICKALHAAHEAGIVHRDLKPENVFLIEREGKGDFVKILDFGIAKNVELAKRGDSRLTHPGMAMGTPEYMAPEQAAGADIDRRIDIYATGAMLYEMLTGHLPHEGENLMQVLSRKASQPVTPPRRYRREMPEGLEQVILGAIAAERDQRYSTMEEFASALLPFTAPGTTSWAELTPPAAAAADSARASQQIRVDASEKKPADPSMMTDPTMPLTGPLLAAAADSSTPARVVSPGEVKLSNEVVPISRSKVPMSEHGVPNLALMETSLVPAVRAPRSRWPIVLVVLIGLGLAGAAGAIWWPRPPPPVAAPDAAVPDAAAPDVAPMPDSGRRKATPEEVERLVEWARLAAQGRRYTRPPKDNVKYLLDRVEDDYPDHPSAVKLRKRVVKQLGRDIRAARRHRQYERAERWLQVWQLLEPTSKVPTAQIARLHLIQGRAALARRKYKAAGRHAHSARKAAPESVAALEFSGDVEMRRGRHARAVKHYEEALKLKMRRGVKRRLRKKLHRAKRLAK